MKDFFNQLKNIKKVFNKDFVITLILVFVSFSMIFVTGAFSSSVSLEKSAHYATQLAKQTDSNLLGMTIESKTQQAPSNYDKDFYALYGVFKQKKITNAVAYNTDKSEDIRIGDISDKNLSMLYIGPVATIDYNDHYKVMVFPIEVMFNDERHYDENPYCVYISQSQADRLLLSKGEEKIDGVYTTQQYYSLLFQDIEVSINGDSTNYLIQNIYYEENYYYDGLKSVINDFVMVSYYIHSNIKRQNIYFMSEYDYQNQYFMKYIKSGYNNEDFTIRVLKNNISEEIDEKVLFGFYYDNIVAKNAVTVLLFIVIGLLDLYICFRLWKKNKNNLNFLSYFILYFVSLFPYLLFKSIYYLSSNKIIFTDLSSKTNVIYVLVNGALMFVSLFVLKNKKSLTISKEEEQHEINI